MCSVIGAISTPRATKAGDQRLGERPAGARHLGTPRLGGVDVLVVRQRPAPCRRSRSGSVRREPRGTPRRTARRAARSARASDAEPDPYDSVVVTRAPPARRSCSPSFPSDGWAPSGLRTSTIRQSGPSAGARVATWTRAGDPSPRRARSAAGNVAETFTTSRSPASRISGTSENVAWVIVSSETDATMSRTPSRGVPHASCGAAASSPVGNSNASAFMPEPRPPGRGSAHSAVLPSISASRPGTLSSGGGRSEMSSPGNASWCIRVRMSPGSTVSTRNDGCSAARIAESCSSAAFDEPYPPQPLVRLDRGIGGDVDDRRSVRHARQRELSERERCVHVDLIDTLKRCQRIVGEQRLRARPKDTRVVDEHVDRVARGVQQRSAMIWVGDVPGDRRDFGPLAELTRDGIEIADVAGVDDERPAAIGE